MRFGAADASTDQPCLYAGVGERKGTYSVDVVAAGYRAANATVVVSRSDECHVQGERVEVPLTAQ